MYDIMHVNILWAARQWLVLPHLLLQRPHAFHHQRRLDLLGPFRHRGAKDLRHPLRDRLVGEDVLRRRPRALAVAGPQRLRQLLVLQGPAPAHGHAAQSEGLCRGRAKTNPRPSARLGES